MPQSPSPLRQTYCLARGLGQEAVRVAWVQGQPGLAAPEQRVLATLTYRQRRPQRQSRHVLCSPFRPFRRLSCPCQQEHGSHWRGVDWNFLGRNLCRGLCHGGAVPEPLRLRWWKPDQPQLRRSQRRLVPGPGPRPYPAHPPQQHGCHGVVLGYVNDDGEQLAAELRWQRQSRHQRAVVRGEGQRHPFAGGPQHPLPFPYTQSADGKYCPSAVQGAVQG